jgi:hypothetical protein
MAHRLRLQGEFPVFLRVRMAHRHIFDHVIRVVDMEPAGVK